VEATNERESLSRRGQLSGSVLVAEDMEELQLLERRILEKMGLQVTMVSNGAEAIEQVQQHPFDLVLMDMQMPVMGGIEATRRLRAAGYDLPIIALSANVMRQHREQFAEAGCDEFLAKPIEDEAIWRVLGRYLGQQEVVSFLPIVWSEAFSVGHPDMDRQHQQMAGLINQLLEQIGQRSAMRTREELLKILPQLSDAYDHHIRAEERLLESVGYGQLEHHRRSHERYNSSLSAIFQLELDETTASSVARTLLDWWHHHILEEDRAYKEAVKGAPGCPLLQKRRPEGRRHALVDDELLAIFAKNVKAGRAELVEALGQGAWERVREVAHRIKGTAMTFGYPQLSDAALHAHRAIDREDSEQAALMCERLIEELGRI
jgi:hemerythrin-like metal-binding protein